MLYFTFKRGVLRLNCYQGPRAVLSPVATTPQPEPSSHPGSLLLAGDVLGVGLDDLVDRLGEGVEAGELLHGVGGEAAHAAAAEAPGW